MSTHSTTFRTQPAVSIGHLFDRAARFFTTKPAVVDANGMLSFEQVNELASSLAGALMSAGAVKGDRVAVILPNSCAFIVSEIGIIKAGMVKVPLNIRFHLNEVLFALKDCEPTMLICEACYAEKILNELSTVPSLKAIFTIGGTPKGCRPFEEATAGPAVHSVDYAPDDPILIRYTGGTTGRPKGIVHTAESFLHINLEAIRAFRITKEDAAIHVGHLSHGLNFMWGAFYAEGATQILYESFDAKRVLRDIERHRITFMYMVPTMIHRLLREDSGEHDVSTLRMFMYASAPMPVPLLKQAIARYGNIFLQVYTLSESPIVTAALWPDEHIDRQTIAGTRLASCGRETVSVVIRLLDESGLEVEPGETGEITIRSIGNMAGYWNRPEETSQTLVDGWIKTGDMARRDEDGFLYLVDRKKDLIITGALNVYPKEVEDVLHAHQFVSQAAVIGVDDIEWGEIIRAYVVLKPNSFVNEEDLIAHCRAHLASYKKPREIRFVDELPLTPVGKVSRVLLREQARAELNNR